MSLPVFPPLLQCCISKLGRELKSDKDVQVRALSLSGPLSWLNMSLSELEAYIHITVVLLPSAILQPDTCTALGLKVARNPIFLDFAEGLAHRSKFCGGVTCLGLNKILVSTYFLKETEIWTNILTFLQVLFLTFAKEAE